MNHPVIQERYVDVVPADNWVNHSPVKNDKQGEKTDNGGGNKMPDRMQVVEHTDRWNNRRSSSYRWWEDK